MNRSELQEQCERGQRELIQTRYLDAVDTFTTAEAVAWNAGDYDTLARLYLPLQEARRQVRQRCGEGVVELAIIADGPGESVDVSMLVDRYPHGQLLIAGRGSVEPAAEFRRLARDRRLYVETFLAAAYSTTGGVVVVVSPLEELSLPDTNLRTKIDLLAALPPGCLTFDRSELSPSPRPGDTRTYAEVMAIWERLHAPFLAAGDAEADPVRRMEKYRLTLRVDPACELAHQRLADVARELSRA